MNNTRRKKINNIIFELQQIKTQIDILRDEENEALYAMEEKFSETERYAKAEEAAENLESAMDAIDDVIGTLEEAAN